jgi:hypothetical protein
LQKLAEVHTWPLNQHLIPYLGRRRLDQTTSTRSPT